MDIFLFYPVEAEHDLEQIAVDGDVERALLELRKALGNAQTEAAALGVARAVAADEALGKLVAADVQTCGGDVAEGDGRLERVGGEVEVHASPALGVFADVVQQVIKDAPHVPPVGHDFHGLLGLCEDKLQPCGGELFAVFARHLVEQDAELALGEVHAQAAARRLGRFKQIVNELLELCRLPVEHLEVLAHLFILRLLLSSRST